MIQRVVGGVIILALLVGCGPAERDSRDHVSYRRDGGQSRSDGGTTDGGIGDGGTTTCTPACEEGKACVAGECVSTTCEQGLTWCNDRCIDPTSNAQHCGGCDNPCSTPGQGDIAQCVASTCRVRCSLDGEGTFCGAPNQCSDGHCCPSGQTWCWNTGSCIDLKNDANNCNECNFACPSPSQGTAKCTNGTCAVTCAQGYSACGGDCVDYSTDAYNCGSCGNSCNGGQCVNKQCVAYSTVCTIDSAFFWQDCNGAIVNPGDVVKFSATGTWSTVSTGATCGPSGYSSNPSFGDYRVDQRFRHGALIYGTDATGTPEAAAAYPTTGTATWTANTRGILFFQVNDSDVSNNSGQMTLTLTITSP